MGLGCVFGYFRRRSLDVSTHDDWTTQQGKQLRSVSPEFRGRHRALNLASARASECQSGAGEEGGFLVGPEQLRFLPDVAAPGCQHRAAERNAPMWPWRTKLCATEATLQVWKQNVASRRQGLAKG